MVECLYDNLLTEYFVFWFTADQSIEHFVFHGGLRFIGSVDVRYVLCTSLYPFSSGRDRIYLFYFLMFFKFGHIYPPP